MYCIVLCLATKLDCLLSSSAKLILLLKMGEGKLVSKTALYWSLLPLKDR
jgi:hypothetical protein